MSYVDILNNSNKNLQKVQRELDNTRQRLQWTGYGQEAEPEQSGSFLTKVLDVLERFGRGAGGAAGEFIAPGLSSTPQFDPFSAFARGFRREERITPKDIAIHHGVSDEPLFNLNVADRFDFSPSPAGIVGLAGEILNPFDPINWLTFGVGGAALKGTSKGLPLLQRAFGDDVAKKLVESLGGVDNIRGADVGELVGNLMKQGQEATQTGSMTPELFENMRGLLQQETQRVGAKKRLSAVEENAIKMGIQVPIVNKKMAEVAIPGSKPIVTSLSRAGQKFMETPMGASLGKAFDTGFLSPRVTNSIIRTLEDGGLEHLTAGEAGKNLRGILRDMDDTVRNDLEQKIKAIRADAEGIPVDRRKLLTRELSMQGRFTQLFDNLSPEDAVQGIQKLGFTDAEATTALRFHNLRREMERWYTQEGIRDTWMPAWVPNMFIRPPGKTEAGVLRLKYGEAVDTLVPHPEAGSFNEELFNVASSQLQFLKNREVTSGALSPQEVNEYLASQGLKPLLEEDLYEIMATVQERFIRSQQAVEAVKMLRNEFGMNVEQLKLAGKKFVPEGYGLFRIKVDEKSGRVTMEKASTQDEGAFLQGLVKGKKAKVEPPSDVFALPLEMSRVWDDYMKLSMNPMERNSFLRFIDKATSQFRTLAYMVTPGHVPRDFVSNLYNLWLMGTRNLSGLPDSFNLAVAADKRIIFPTSKGLPDIPRQGWTYVDKSMRRSGKDGAIAIVREDSLETIGSMMNKSIQIGGKNYTYYRILREASKRGVIDTGWWSLEGPKTGALGLDRSLGNKMKQLFLQPDPQKNLWTQGMVNITKITDNSSRIMGFIDNLKRGDSFADAAAKVKTYLFDYGDLTSFEKQWMRRIFPFYCLSESAEALTRGGWKKHNEVVVGEEVLTYNVHTRQTEWKPVLGVFVGQYKGKMMRMHGQSLSTLCTPDHNWVVRRTDGQHEPELQEAWRIRSNYRLVVGGEYNSPEDYPIPDDMLRIVGWLSTDGYSRQKGTHWEHIIYQHPKKFAEEIRETLGRCGEFHEVQHPNGTIQFYLKGDLRKEVCRYFHTKEDLWGIVVNLSRRQLDILYDVMFKADGCSNHGDFFAAQDETTRNIFQTLCYLRGRLANLGDRGMYIRQEGRHEIKYNALDVGMVDYEGYVWCPKTENDTWVARDNGKVFATGNTWMRKNIPLQIKEAFKQPGKLGTVGKIHRSVSEDQEPGDTPGFLEESAAMLLPGEEMFLSSPLPYQDLSRLPKDWATLSEQLSNINPLFRMPIELAMNKKFFSGLPIEQYADEKAEGVLGDMGLDRRGLAYLMENIPLYRNVATMTPQAPDWGPLGELLSGLGLVSGSAETSDEEGRRLARMLSFVLGPQVFSAQRAKEISSYEERDRLRALVRLLKDSGIDVPELRDIK